MSDTPRMKRAFEKGEEAARAFHSEMPDAKALEAFLAAADEAKNRYVASELLNDLEFFSFVEGFQEKWTTLQTLRLLAKSYIVVEVGDIFGAIKTIREIIDKSGRK